MLVILNSDVLYTNVFSRERLVGHLERFAAGCRDVNGELVIPQTALYEVELRQKELFDAEMSELRKSIGLLQKHGVRLDPPDIASRLNVPNLVELLRATGVKVSVEQTTLEDFREAERRAALHLPPAQPRQRSPDGKAVEQSDEMRDLVIWAVACRLAKARGGALIVSRDEVHTRRAAREEGEALGLMVAIAFEEALGALGAETEAGKQASQYLKAAWPNLRKAGMPLGGEPKVRSITGVSFLQGRVGLEKAQFIFATNTDDGKVFSANVDVSQITPGGFTIALSDAKIGKKLFGQGTVQVQIQHQLPPQANDYDERLKALRESLE